MTLTGFKAAGFMLLVLGVLVGLVAMCWVECKFGNPKNYAIRVLSEIEKEPDHG